jgi:dsRNA-specific ribonuclease
MTASLEALEALVGHDFRDRTLLERALTHSSVPGSAFSPPRV